MSQSYEREQVSAIRAVSQAAKLCQAARAELRPDVLDKKDKSPVTVADFGSQAVICKALAEALPDDPIIAEEDAADLSRPEQAAILDRVVQHVRTLGLRSDPSAAD